MSEAREPPLLDERLLDQRLAAKLHRAADAGAEREPEAPLDAAAQARVLAAMLAQSERDVRTARRGRAWQVGAFAVAASLALGLWLGAKPEERRASAPAIAAGACGLPADLTQARFVASQGRQLLALGALGRIAAAPDAELTVSAASPCELVITLARGTLAADLHDLRPARLSIRTALGDVEVRGTTFSVRVEQGLEVALLKGAVDVVAGPDATVGSVDRKLTRLTPGHVLQQRTHLAAPALGLVSERDRRTISDLIEPGPQPYAVAPSAGEPPGQRADAGSAETPVTRVERVRARSATELLATAERARRAGKFDQARSSYRLAGSQRGADAEVALLRWARLELSASQPAAAIDVLELYQQRFAHGRLAAEAAWLQLRALEQQGRSEDASDVARELVRRFPDSPHAKAAQRLLP